MNYFIEGLQGSGKSTLMKKLSAKYPDHRAVYEGDYSPVELAWCAWVSRDKFREILDKYQAIRQDIEAESHAEEDGMVICYTKVRTDIPGFYQDLEQYEIYNGRMDFEEWKGVILSRFGKWTGGRNIFECSLFQNIVEDMILFRNASDREIFDFYREIRSALREKDYRILYLKTDDIAASIDAVRKERTDEQGEEQWYRMLCGYFDASPFAVKHGVSGPGALLEHLKHRQELELKICAGLFPDRVAVLRSREYREDEI